MIYDKLIEEMKRLNSIDLQKMINEDMLFITFEDESINEFNLPIREGSVAISVRNKYLNGHNGKPIEHDPTIKIIINNKSIPIIIEHTPQLHKDANNDKNRKLIIPYMPIIKKFIFENRKDLIKYWYADPSTVQGSKNIESLQKRINRKYYKEN